MENCNLTGEHIEILCNFIQLVPTLQYVSVNGNPNDKQNHHLLLWKTSVNVLSLKFCGINEEGMANICKVLYDNVNHPLVHLNLTTNSLYDKGMEHLANILRINRNIKSLNLTDNKIRSRGLQLLLEPLKKFPLSPEELMIRRKLKFDYYKKKVSYISYKI